jgi:hypothetical protein
MNMTVLLSGGVSMMCCGHNCDGQWQLTVEVNDNCRVISSTQTMQQGITTGVAYADVENLTRLVLV